MSTRQERLAGTGKGGGKAGFHLVEQLPALMVDGRRLDVVRRAGSRAYFVVDAETATPLGGPYQQLHVARAWADGYRNGEHDRAPGRRK